MKRITQLDGLRGVAVLLVLINHIGMPNFGRIGVDTFFVLSGFLITGILLDTREDPHWLRRFYIRRTKRIFPIYYATLLLIALAYPHVTPLKTYFFMANWNVTSVVWGTQHFWSLSIEEQFYLGWSIMVWKLPPRTLARIAIAGVVLDPFARFAMELYSIDYGFPTLLRLDGLFLGSLIALSLRTNPQSINVKLGWRLTMFFVPLALMLFHFRELWWLKLSLANLASAGILILGILGGMRWLTFLPLRLLGRWSYGIYVYHLPLFCIFPRNNWIEIAEVLAITLVVSILSFEFFEKPIMNFDWPKPNDAGLTASLKPVSAGSHSAVSR